jgi:hypothetical protein
MSMVWDSWLARIVNQDNLHTKNNGGNYTTGLYRKIGNVTYLISPRRERPHVVKLILEEEIKPAVAERLAKLVSVDFLFTLKIWENVVFIPSFTDAASLEDILNVRARWPFDPEHSMMLADDVGTPYHLRMQ